LFSPRPIATVTARPSAQSQTAGEVLFRGRPRRYGQIAADDGQVNRQRHDSAVALRLHDHVFDRSPVAAKDVHAAVDDDLRRINLAVAAHVGIGALPRRMRRIGERILPAEIIPVIDRQAERDDAGFDRKLAQQLVRRGTGRAALAGEQFQKRMGFAGAGDAVQCDQHAHDNGHRRQVASQVATHWILHAARSFRQHAHNHACSHAVSMPAISMSRRTDIGRAAHLLLNSR